MRRDKKTTLYVALAVALLLSGCANSTVSRSNHFQEPERVQQIRINKSTKQQVRALLGEPQSITVRSNENEIWVYQKKHTTYTEKFAAKTALSFVPIPYLGSAVGLADKVVDAGPDKRVESDTLTLTFNKRGLLVETKREKRHM